MAEYIGIVHKEKKSDYGVCFPDFPGCVTAGKTVEEAYAMAKEALQFHMAGMAEDGERIPAPMTFHEAKKHPFHGNALLMFMVEAKPPRRAHRINVMMDEALIRAIDQITANRSAFLSQAAEEKLHRK